MLPKVQLGNVECAGLSGGCLRPFPPRLHLHTRRLTCPLRLVFVPTSCSCPRLMTVSLDRLPFDLLFCITSNLDIEDLVHLGQTCRQLRASLDERTISRRTVEVVIPVLVIMLTLRLMLLIDQLSTHERGRIGAYGKNHLQTSFANYLRQKTCFVNCESFFCPQLRSW